MNPQPEQKVQSEQPLAQFMRIEGLQTQAEDLLATLRQSFLFYTGKQNPMRILNIVEDAYPDTETDCDMLRLSVQMAKDMGTVRVMPMRVYHLGKIAEIIKTRTPVGILNS